MAWWPDTAFRPRRSPPRLAICRFLQPAIRTDTVEVVFRPDPNIYDGRYANMGWLQEIPKPVTNMSWDNAALMSYRTLAKLGLAEQDVIAITSNGNKVMAPVMAVPGHRRWLSRCTWATAAATAAAWAAAWASTPTRSAPPTPCCSPPARR